MCLYRSIAVLRFDFCWPSSNKVQLCPSTFGLVVVDFETGPLVEMERPSGSMNAFYDEPYFSRTELAAAWQFDSGTLFIILKWRGGLKGPPIGSGQVMWSCGKAHEPTRHLRDTS